MATVFDLLGTDESLPAWHGLVGLLDNAVRDGDDACAELWLAHFVGRQADEASGQQRAACLLWDLARERWQIGEQGLRMDRAQRICSDYVRQVALCYKDEVTRVRYAALRGLDAIFAVAHAAFSAREPETASNLGHHLATAVRAWACARHRPDEDPTSDQSDLPVPGDLPQLAFDVADFPPIDWATATARAVLTGLQQAWNGPLPEKVLLPALAMTDRAFRWILGHDDPSESRESLILTVARRRIPGGEVTEQGSLARLVLTPWDIGSAFGSPILFPDPVYLGMMLPDDDWHDHFAQALAWASGYGKGPEAFHYRVEFFAREEVDEEGRHARPPILEGYSASASAGCLIRSLREGLAIDPDRCLTAGIAKTPDCFTLLAVGGTGLKLVGLADTFRMFGRRPEEGRPTVLTPVDKKESTAELQRILGMPCLPVHDPNDAYARMTVRRQALQHLLDAQRQEALERLAFLLPQRLRGLDMPDLEELDVPAEANSAPSPGREGKQPDLLLLDEVLETDLAQGKTGPWLIHGSPGSGKTWLTVRWLLRLQYSLLATDGIFDRPGFSPPWLPFWTTCRDLGQTLSPDVPLLDGLKAIAGERLRRILGQRIGTLPGNDRLPEALDDLLTDRFQNRRVLLIVDAWDERDSDHTDVLRTRLIEWCREEGRPMLLTSRLVAEAQTPHQVFAGLAKVRTLRLNHLRSAAGGWQELVLRWFGPDKVAAKALLDLAAGRSRLQQLLCVPLLGALVCRLREEGLEDLPDRPTPLLLRALERLLERPRPEIPDSPPARVLVSLSGADRLDLFADLAFATCTGNRWTLTRGRLQTALAGLADRWPTLARHVDEVPPLLAGPGLFTDTKEGRWEVLHQSFAEVLCARAITVRLASGTQPAVWLREHAGLRLLDPHWREVWSHLAGQLEDATPLLEELWSIHQGTGTLQDDMLGSALNLAGLCLAAAGSGWEGGVGKDILHALVKRWKAVKFEPTAPVGKVMVELGRAGCLAPFRELLEKGKPPELRSILESVGEIGPAAQPLVSMLIGLLEVQGTQIGVPRAAAGAMGRLGETAREAIPALESMAATETGELKRIALEALAQIDPARSAILSSPGDTPVGSTVEEMRSQLLHEDPQQGTQTLLSLWEREDLADSLLPSVLDLLDRQLRLLVGTTSAPTRGGHDPSLRTAREAIQVLGSWGNRAAGASRRLRTILQEMLELDKYLGISRDAIKALASIGCPERETVFLLANLVDHHNMRVGWTALEALGRLLVPEIEEVFRRHGVGTRGLQELHGRWGDLVTPGRLDSLRQSGNPRLEEILQVLGERHRLLFRRDGTLIRLGNDPLASPGVADEVPFPPGE